MITVTLSPGVTKAKGKFVKFEPHETELMTQKFDAILEYVLRNFPVLHVGDCIPISFNNKMYHMDVQEVFDINKKHEYNAICIIETDIEVDFAKPRDYDLINNKPKLEKKASNIVTEEMKNHDQNEKNKEPEFFMGSAIRIDGKKVDEAKLKKDREEKLKRQQEQLESWDPRQHRIQHGVRAELSHFETLTNAVKIKPGKK